MPHASFNSLIDRIYQVPAGETGWDALTPLLEKTLGGSVAFFAQRADRVSTVAPCSDCTVEAMRDYERRLWPEDRAMYRLRDALADDIVVDSDLIGADERSRSAFYGGFLASRGFARGLYASVWQHDGESFVVSTQRHARAPRFTRADAEMLRALAPHFARSLQIWRKVERERQERHAALKAAERSSVGLVLADGTGKVHFINEIARRELAEGVLTLAGGRLRAAGTAGRAILHEALATVLTDTDAGERAVQIPACAAGEALSLSVARVSQDKGSNYGALAMVVLGGGSAAPAIEPSLARAAFGLTEAEARLLAALVSGQRLNAYASDARISLTTAKTHLRSLFDKTGERRQADLIRRALASPVLRRHHGG